MNICQDDRIDLGSSIKFVHFPRVPLELLNLIFLNDVHKFGLLVRSGLK